MFYTCLESDTPTLRDLNNYVTRKYAYKWKDVGVELGIKLYELNRIEKDNPKDSRTCFQEMLHYWLKSSSHATWKMLEDALTNAIKQECIIDEINGKEL